MSDQFGRTELSNDDFLARARPNEPFMAYTDGACKGNPGPGGWGAVVIQKTFTTTLHGPAEDTTNNRMELMAAIEALSFLPYDASIHLSTDSQYVKNGIQSWIHGWKRNGWVTKDKKPVKNAELWQRLDREAGLRKVEWAWVKGHANNPYNERADRLASSAIREKSTANRSDFTAMSAPDVAYGEASVSDMTTFLGLVDKSMVVKVWTDGSAKVNPGPGGWGVVMQQGAIAAEMCGGEKNTTNNRMELMAAIQALDILPGGFSVELTTDSSYVRGGITSWILSWKRNGWKTSDKNDVKNKDLWERLDKAKNKHRVKWNWVKGHSGQPQNERADELARAGSSWR